MVSFLALGSPAVVARAIEECAHGQGHVSAIVVPWESTPEVLSMSVTSVRTDGWAIEHINLGTIRLIDQGDERTEVAVTAEPSEAPDRQKLAAVFERFVALLHNQLPAATARSS
ncbi:MAG: hypothetical protein HY047_09675 [Acidobacteria bacterium]|nr:hypothetical protein [Acidobacteriota bacterium]